jgi:PKD repeat protein
MVEQGVGIKVGLDTETNATVNGLIDTIEDMPGSWEDTMTEIIMALETSTSNVADDLADDVAGLMVEARLNTQQITASAGAEFRCNVDFMSTRAGDTIDQFIGKSLVGQLRRIFSDEPAVEDQIPTPWICQVIPDQIDLVEIGGQTLFDMSVVKLSGYNFVEENKPVAHLVDGENNPIESVSFFPTSLSSPYQIQLNMQGVDFSSVPYGAKLVFEWPTEGTSNSLSVIFPIDEPTPTPEVQPELMVNVSSLEVKKGPGNGYFTIGLAVQGASYEVTGHNGDQSWWQIDFENDPGWVPASSVTRNEEPIGPASSIPFDPPTAAFSMSPTSGEAPLTVDIWDQSTGNPTSLNWQLESGGGAPSSLGMNSSFSYEFSEGGTYTVTLYVENEWGEDQISKNITIESPPLVLLPIVPIKPLVPIFSATATPDYSTKFLFRNYTNVKAGDVFVTDIPTSTYNCSIISLAALHGDIEEHNAGNVLKLWLANNGPYWTITPNFRTHRADHGGQEKWSLGVMCADKNNSRFFSDIFIKPPTNPTVSLNPAIYEIPDDYTCLISGYDIKNVNVEDDTAGDIIQVYTRKVDGEWQVTADFMEEGGDESWIVQMMCFYDNPSVVLTYDDPVTNLSPFSIETGGYQTSISASEYACGVAGMHALDGNINENDNGDIIRVFTMHDNTRWHVFADFRTHGQDEMWDIDLICVKRSVSDIQMNQWFGGWIEN